MRTYNFKKTLSGKFIFAGINLKNFPSNEENSNCISVLENSNIENKSTFLLKGSRRGVKKFQTWLKNFNHGNK